MNVTYEMLYENYGKRDYFPESGQQQRIVQTKRSIVPRVKNPALETGIGIELNKKYTVGPWTNPSLNRVDSFIYEFFKKIL